jgi:hypothetical protein
MIKIRPTLKAFMANGQGGGHIPNEASVEGPLPYRKMAALAVAQAFFSLNSSVVITLGALSGWMLADNKAFATVPLGCLVVGSALSTAPARLLIEEIGWRAGFILGGGAGVLGGLLAIYAIEAGSFNLFCLAMAMVGVYQAFAYYYRFAATEDAPEDDKAKVVSWVMFAGTTAAVVGPSLVVRAEAWRAPVPFSGGFLVAVAASLGGMAAAAFLSGRPAGLRPPVVSAAARPLLVILRQRRLLIAIACGMIATACMGLVMHASPIAMKNCNDAFTVKDVVVPIQWHVVAMFGPSLFVGAAIKRFDPERVILVGMILIAAASFVALDGNAQANFSAALGLLGVGWNMAYVGSTVVVAGCHSEGEKVKVQAFNDVCMLSLVAIASVASGVLVQAYGWQTVNFLQLPLTGLAALMVASLLWERR